MLINLAHAQDAVAATGGSTNFLMQIAPLLPMIVIFYFFFIRPQRKRALEHKSLITNLKKGDQVVTNGGIIASVVKNAEKDPYIIAEIADSMRVRLTRESVTGMFVNDNKKHDDESSKDNKKQAIKGKNTKVASSNKGKKPKNVTPKSNSTNDSAAESADSKPEAAGNE